MQKFYVSCKILDNLKISSLNRIIFQYKIPFPKVFQYAGSTFNKDFNNLSNNTLLEGYWQSEQYFADQHKIIRERFRFKSKISEKNREILNRIVDSNSVSVHIRRGDYAINSVINNIHGLMGKEYYNQSIALLSSKITKPVLFFFSDDINWAKTSFNQLCNSYDTFFINHNTGKDAFEDMRLMSNCKHNIIANSSFSWWGAWLNKNPEKIVIAPQLWFNDASIDTKDLIPETCIRL